MKSTYGIKKDFSFKSEEFIYIPLTWKLGVSRIEALKIRIAKWKPKYDRSNQAIFYFDVNTKDEANEILKKFNDFNFIKLENRFDKMYDSQNIRIRNTGEAHTWLLNIITILREEFKLVKN